MQRITSGLSNTLPTEVMRYLSLSELNSTESTECVGDSEVGTRTDGNRGGSMNISLNE